MPSDWQTWTLAECMSAIIDYRGKTPTKSASGIPLVTAKVIKNGWIQTPTEFIAPQSYDSWMTRGLPKVGDVLLTTEAPIGEIAQVRDARVALAQRVILLRGQPDLLDNCFLKYLLQDDSVQHQLRARSTGTTVTGIKQSELRKLELQLPGIEEQRRIADVLDCLDQRVHSLEEMMRTMESIASAIFKSWFVDFDPVRAKAEGREPEGMDAAVAALFPSALIRSGTEDLPEGWQADHLGSRVSINPTRRLPRGQIATYLDMANVPVAGPAPREVVQREVGSGCKFVNGDTLFAKITPCLENGKTAFVDFLRDGEVAWGSTELIVLSALKPIPPQFIYLLARDAAFRSFAERGMTGTSGRQRVSPEHLRRYRIAFATSDVYEAFGEIVEPLFRHIRANADLASTLEELRDTLLPRLISGKLRIPEAEKLVASAL